MDILRDPIWQFLGAVIGVAGIALAFARFKFQKNTKRLVYALLTETPLLSIEDEIKSKIKIKYGTKNIQNIYLVVLKIENAGNVDIASSDYEQSIIFSFPDSEILSNKVMDTSPKNLKPIITSEVSKLIIDPILLNKGDYIVAKLLFSKYEKNIIVDSRIIGVKEIERVISGGQKATKSALVASGFFVLFSFFVLLSIFLLPITIQMKIWLYFLTILTFVPLNYYASRLE